MTASGIRHELADRLEAAVVDRPVSVWPETPRESGLPALVIAPGRPEYRRRPDSDAARTGCVEVVRLDVIAAVSKESATALDELDELAAVVETVIRAMPGARWLGVSSGRDPDQLAGTPVYRQNVQLEVLR